ncbi:MAG: hypothetical protein FWF92_03910 [Oscillospiraceae bacterium]|nr:hypothetical protein [Oscillospiraceae bacterium]
MNISEKVAYLKGLAEGLEISSDSKNGKIIKGILDVLADISESVEILEDETATLDDYITEVDEDLGQLEEDFEKTCGYKLYEKEKNSLIDMHTCEDEDEFEDLEDFEYEDEDDLEDDALLDGIVEIKCPKCNKHIFVETDDLLDSDYINCSECGGEIKVVNEMTDGENCSCGHCIAQNEENNKDELAF